MTLEISGNADPYLDYHIRKYLDQVATGALTFEAVVHEMKRLVLAAAAEDPAFYYLIGEGDPIVSASGQELGYNPAHPSAGNPLTADEVAAARKTLPKWAGRTSAAND